MAAPAIYVLNSTDVQNFTTSSKAPNIAVRTSWQHCNPSQNTYNWNIIMSALAALPANGQLSISIPTGWKAPSWVLSQVPTIWSTDHSRQYPAPWNSTYQSIYSTFVQAFGAQFSNNPQINRVTINLFNTDTPEIALCHPNMGTPDATLTLANWQSIGYTAAAAQQAYEYSCQQMYKYCLGFPSISMWIARNGGLAFDTVSGSSTIAAMMTWLDSVYAVMNGRVMNGNAGANTNWAMPFPSTLPIAYQEGSSAGYGSGVAQVIAQAEQYGAAALEIYASDVPYLP